MQKIVVDRKLSVSEQSFFLFGPRGTGKSTWLMENYRDSLLFDMLDPLLLRSLTANPERLMELIRASRKKTILIDEVQRVPTLLDIVHQYMERYGDKQFVLTGSSARKLKRVGVNLLAGRAIVRRLYPFLPCEISEQFSLEEALEFGLVPLIWFSSNRRETLNAYLGVYLKEEVQNEGLVRRLDSFSRFLTAVSFSQASLLNLAEVSRECEVERKTIAGFVEVLEDLLLAEQVPVFSKKSKRKLIKHSKFYFFDVGVYRSIRPTGPLDRPEEIHGAATETLVFQCLHAYLAYRSTKNELYFWRTQSGNEVDFIVYGDDGLFAIEVKNARQVHKKDLRSLHSFQEDFPLTQSLLLFRGPTPLVMNGILCLPLSDFLKRLDPDLSLREILTH
ncbi:MAG: ATP-binding protein [Deltaproteobacteria bacterium]|nr:ATP-binding protein [Deltaproteobacteria bacterium]